MSSTSKYITIEEAVASALTLLPGATDSERVFMRHWVYLGNRDLGLSKENVENISIKVQDLTARKPDNLLSIAALGIYDYNDNEYNHIYKGYGDLVHKDLDDIDGSYKYNVTITEDDFHLHLSSNGANIDYIKIRYYAIPVDADGNPKILERKRLAITFFLQWMWSIRQNDNQAAVDRAERRWLVEAAKQRSKNKMPSVKEAQGISKWYLSMISTPEIYGY